MFSNGWMEYDSMGGTVDVYRPNDEFLQYAIDIGIKELI
jgi:hypothetical protein